MGKHSLSAIIVRGFAVSLIFIVITVPSVADVSLTTGEWVNSTLWRLEAKGLIKPIFASSRPFEREEIAQIVAITKERIKDGDLKPNDLELALINKLEAEFDRDLRPSGLEARGLISGELDYADYRVADEWDLSSLSLWGAASYHPSPMVTLYEEIDVRRGREIIKTASKRMNPWKWDYTADFRRAYVSVNGERFVALLGRQSLFWGPGYDGSLTISGNSPAFDMMLLEAKFGPVKAITFSAVLDKMWSEHGNPPYRYLANRYLSGHRIDWIVNDRIELGLSELVLYGGETRSMEWYYINPLLPYYASQWNSNQDDNVLVSADFAVRSVDKMKLYGQFLVDDFSYSGDDPNALGYIAGVYLSDPLGISKADFRVEYTRVDSHTYTHRITENQFVHYGWVMGHHLGPDSDQLLVELSRIESADMRINLTYIFGRKRSGIIADSSQIENNNPTSFPSGTLVRQHRIGLRFLWEPLSRQQMDISWTGIFTRSNHRTESDIELRASVGFLAGTRWLESGNGNDQKGIY